MASAKPVLGVLSGISYVSGIHRVRATAAVLAAVLLAAAAGQQSSQQHPVPGGHAHAHAPPPHHVLKNATLMNHNVVVDATGKIVPWIESADPFADLLELAWKWWVRKLTVAPRPPGGSRAPAFAQLQPHCSQDPPCLAMAHG